MAQLSTSAANLKDC